MLEVEVKAVVDDVAARAARLAGAGAEELFSGRMRDLRYDTADRSLAAVDQVLRVRVYESLTGNSAHLDWKGATRIESGLKWREELTTGVTDVAGITAILEALGYLVTREIQREVWLYRVGEATVRFERYPRMDDLVEVEGPPPAIESAIAALGMDRAAFTAERLPDFAHRFEERTGQRAALCDAELRGEYVYDLEQA
ncbi:MAG TPA: class IV adenylate cyclase [Gemmatimonadaceae bacterium]|nr:class IV adenylate cyclase [Gemmatimonadaceae bacterium]